MCTDLFMSVSTKCYCIIPWHIVKYYVYILHRLYRAVYVNVALDRSLDDAMGWSWSWWQFCPALACPHCPRLLQGGHPASFGATHILHQPVPVLGAKDLNICTKLYKSDPKGLWLASAQSRKSELCRILISVQALLWQRVQCFNVISFFR